jgi:crotonobetainyl-CoA:carnitine CoA-transferase CaiB-like acyl-CoA transferase
MVLPSGETTHTIASPVRLNGRSPVTHVDPPAPGAHTGDILAELGADGVGDAAGAPSADVELRR